MKRYLLKIALPAIALTVVSLMPSMSSAESAPPQAAPATEPGISAARSGQKIVIPISTFSDAQLGGYWTLRMASGLQERGAQVTILLFTNGVRFADNRAVDDFGIEGESIPISRSFSEFVGKGGRILVEANYAGKIGLAEQYLRAGSKLADDGAMCDIILGSDKILSF